MSVKYLEYESVMVRLSDVLGLLDERLETMTSGLLTSQWGTDEESIKQVLGKAQGMQMALKAVQHQFGATTDGVAPPLGGGYL